MKPDRLIRSRRKSYAIIIEKDGSLTVRAPQQATLAQVEEVLQEKEGWIRKGQERNRELWQREQPKSYRDGEEFLFLGKSYRLKIVEQQKPALVFKEGFYLTAAGVKSAGVLFEQWYREQARRVLAERVRLYAQKHGFSYRSVRITSARTRWGSCSSTGSLNFTWRLAMAPLEIIDYVVIHELVHLEEKNHSSRYWAKVERLMPDYKKRREWLRKNGGRLQ